MRVQRTENNVNFQMALKINPGLKEKIAERGLEYVEKLNKIGQDIAEVKLYDVILDNSLTPKVRKTNINNPYVRNTMDYFQFFRKREKNVGKVIYEDCGDETHVFSIPNEPYLFIDIYGADAAKKYAEYKKLDEISQAAEFSKLMEQKDIQNLVNQEKQKSEQMTKELIEKEEREKVERAADNLFSRYGVKPFETEKTAENETEKKSFWKRIFG